MDLGRRVQLRCGKCRIRNNFWHLASRELADVVAVN